MHLFRLKEKLASAGLIRSREGSLDKKNNKFVSAQPVKHVQNNNIIGLEYHENIRTDDDYVQKVFETSSYQESHKLADCPYIKMPGCLEHHTCVGTYPAFTSAFSNTSGRALEHTLGIYVADKLKSKTHDREGLRQEDFYLTKLKWLIRMAKGELQSSKCNLNNLRMSIEKIMEEAAPAFDYELFQDQKKALKILKKLTYFLLKVEPQKAILLSYKLFKMRIKQLDLQDPQSRLEVANKLHTFFIPYVKLLEIKDISRLGMLQKRKDNLATYYKTKNLCAMPEIASILKEYPDKKQSPTYTSKFRAFLGERITLDKALADLVPKSMRISTAESSVAENSDIGIGSLDNLDQVPAEMMASQGLGYENAKSIELDELNEVPTIGVKNYNFLGRRDQQDENSTPIKIVDSSLDSFRGRITPVLTPIKAKELNLSTDKSNMDSEINELMNDPELYRPSEEIKSSKEGTPSHFQRSAMKKKSTVTPLPANMLTSECHPHKHVTINKVFDTSYDEINIATDPTRTSYKPDMIRVNSSNVLPRETQPPMRESVFRSQNRKPSVFQKDRIIKDTKKEMIYQKVLSIASDNVSKWDNIVNNPTIKIDKIKPENSPVVLLRAWALIEGFTPKEVFDQIFDTTQRCKWDTVTTDLQVVETLENNSEVIYFYIKTPFGITERDFVQRRDYIFNYPEKDSIVVSFQSCSHPAKPPLKKRIRGETHIAGYVIKPSATRPNSTDLCILSQVDIKGQVPKAIVNMVAGKAPAEWVNKLKKACENARNKK